MGHHNRTGRYCSRKDCDDRHPYHLANGKISRSIRPFVGGLLSDELEMKEIDHNLNRSHLAIPNEGDRA